MSPLPPASRRLLVRTANALGVRRPMPRGRRLVLHLGSQKTGTTAVQAWCREHVEELARAGVTTRTHQPQIRRALGGWYEASRDDAEARLRSYLDWTWRDTRAPGLFYSCESNVGAAFADDSPELYPRIAANLAAVERATAGVPRHVQFCVRSYGDFLESAYLQQLKHGQPRSFDALSRRVQGSLSWRPVVTALVETFGAENVTVYDYDKVRPAGTSLVRQVLVDAMSHLGAPGHTVDVDEDRRTNQRYSGRMADLSLAVLPLTVGTAERSALHRFAVTTLGHHPAPDDAPARFLTEEVAAALADRYAADVAWARDRVPVR